MKREITLVIKKTKKNKNMPLSHFPNFRTRDDNGFRAGFVKIKTVIRIADKIYIIINNYC